MAEKDTKRGRPRYGSEQEKVEKFSTSLSPDIYARLVKYCQDDERAKSWCIGKAVDAWLKERGY